MAIVYASVVLSSNIGESYESFVFKARKYCGFTRNIIVYQLGRLKAGIFSFIFTHTYTKHIAKYEFPTANAYRSIQRGAVRNLKMDLNSSLEHFPRQRRNFHQEKLSFGQIRLYFIKRETRIIYLI